MAMKESRFWSGPGGTPPAAENSLRFVSDASSATERSSSDVDWLEARITNHQRP